MPRMSSSFRLVFPSYPEQRCPREHVVKLCAVRDSAGSNSALSWRAQGQTLRCHGERRVNLCSVMESTRSNSALSWRARGQLCAVVESARSTMHCHGERRVNNALSWRAQGQTLRCHGERGVKLSAFLTNLMGKTLVIY